jgi:phospholipase D1/2
LSPLALSSIKGIKELASNNGISYQTVFFHTPGNSFKLLTQGRKNAYPQIRRRTMSRIFLSPLGCEPNICRMVSHYVDKAVAYLRTHVKGFWVEMPLDWGYAQGKTPAPPISLPKSIAKVEEHGGVEEAA